METTSLSMNRSRITAALPVQDARRAKTFYNDRVGLQVRAAVAEMRGRGVEFEEYDSPETRTHNGIARTPDGGEGAWFKDSEGNLVGVVHALTS